MTTELQRVLAMIEQSYAWAVETGKGGRPSTEVMHDAARLLREMAADFAAWSEDGHAHPCPLTILDADIAAQYGKTCTCGLDAARSKWRLEP